MPKSANDRSEIVTGVRSILSIPRAYRLAQRAVGADRFRRRLVTDVLRVGSEERILDLGCGTGDILDALPTVDYIGFDHSADYIEEARAAYGDRGEFIVATSDGVEDLARDRSLAMMIGVLHHLDDDEALAALRLAAAKLTDAGRFVSIDPTFVPGQSTIARILAKNDRGKHVRTPDEIAALAEAVFESVQTEVRHDMLRVPYSHVIVRARGAKAA